MVASYFGVFFNIALLYTLSFAKSGQFRLSGKKELQPSDTVLEIVVVDATEQPIERPKKSNADTTAVRRKDTRKKMWLSLTSKRQK